MYEIAQHPGIIGSDSKAKPCVMGREQSKDTKIGRREERRKDEKKREVRGKGE